MSNTPFLINHGQDVSTRGSLSTVCILLISEFRYYVCTTVLHSLKKACNNVHISVIWDCTVIQGQTDHYVCIILWEWEVTHIGRTKQLYAVDKGLYTWLKRPTSVVIDSATYLLTIGLTNIDNVAMSLYDIKVTHVKVYYMENVSCICMWKCCLACYPLLPARQTSENDSPFFISVHMHVQAHVCECIHMCLYEGCVCVCVCVHVQAHVCECIHMCLYESCVCVCACVFVCVWCHSKWRVGPRGRGGGYQTVLFRTDLAR